MVAVQAPSQHTWMTAESRNLRGLGKFGCAPRAVRWTGVTIAGAPAPLYGKPWLPDLSASGEVAVTLIRHRILSNTRQSSSTQDSELKLRNSTVT
jgi:hypothetical protein